MSVWISRLIVLAIIGTPLAFGAVWGFDHLRGRFMDVDEAITAYYDGDHRSAFRAFQRLAPEGDPRAQLWLGIAHVSGHGVEEHERDYRLGQTWLRRALDQGNADAAVVLANSTQQFTIGNYGRQVGPETFELYEFAAGLGHGQGMLGVALGHLSPMSGVYNPELARDWLNRALEHGNGHAGTHLAWAYEQGLFGEIDIPTVIDGHLRSGLAGYDDSFQLALGYLSEKESGGYDPQAGYKWSIVALGLFPIETGIPIYYYASAMDALYTQSPAVEAMMASADTDLSGFSEVIAAVRTRMDSIVQPQDEPMPLLPTPDGWSLNLDAEAVRRAESEARAILDGHPEPEPGRPRYGCMCKYNPDGTFHWAN